MRLIGLLLVVGCAPAHVGVAAPQKLPDCNPAVSPLLRFRTNGWNTPDGAVVRVSPLAGKSDEVLADLRCHRTWVAQHHAGGPLALPGLEMATVDNGEGVAIVLAMHDAALVPELQRRLYVQVAARDVPEHDGE
jgi:hypothetical protein